MRAELEAAVGAEHVERLYRSLRYLRIDIGLEPKEVVAIGEEVVLRNEHRRSRRGRPSSGTASTWWFPRSAAFRCRC